MRFIASNPSVDVVIPGMANEKEIEENAKSIFDTSPLSCDEEEKIAKIRESLGTNFCRRCNYCAPCTVGINIPSVFLLEGYFSRYDLKDWAQVRYSALGKFASDCIECGVCETRCPYNLPIREMLKKASGVFGK
jgi:predicted aldo/keto reductase-like oxidoreductase